MEDYNLYLLDEYLDSLEEEEELREENFEISFERERQEKTSFWNYISKTVFELSEEF